MVLDDGYAYVPDSDDDSGSGPIPSHTPAILCHSHSSMLHRTMNASN